MWYINRIIVNKFLFIIMSELNKLIRKSEQFHKLQPAQPKTIKFRFDI